MQEKVVLVTGSSRGIGKSIIIEFAKNGYNVVINYNNSEKEAFALKKEVEEKYGIKALTIRCNVTEEEDIKNMFSSIKDTFSHLDVLVNNAAVENNSDFFDKDKASFKKVLDTNLIAPFLVSKEASKIMREHGKIINISSNNGINKYDSTTVEYDVSKSGLNLLTKIMAKALGPKICVNAVAPGWVLTEKNRELDNQLDKMFIEQASEDIYLKRFAKPEEIAKVVLFLASSDADYINGEIIVVDGGS